jgi:hypothetical protein
MDAGAVNFFGTQRIRRVGPGVLSRSGNGDLA